MFNFLRRLFGRSGSRETDERDDGDSVIAFVAMLAEPADFSLQSIQIHASELFGVDLTSSHTVNDAQDFVVGDEAPFILKCRGCMLLIHRFANSYFGPDADAATMSNHEEVRDVIRRCEAWASVDLMVPETNSLELRRIMAELLLRLVDEEACLGFFAPHLGMLRPNERRFRKQLRIEDPDEAFRENDPSIISAEPDDTELAKASDQARRTWNEFVEAFRAQRPGEVNFAVKTAFTEGDEVEHMWVEVERIDGDVIHGRLGNRPENITRYMLGDPVRVSRQDVSDWVYMRGKKVIGGYTAKVFAKREGTTLGE